MTRALRQLAPDELVGLCARHFDLEAEFGSFLPGEVAINVLLRRGDERFVLKAERPTPSTTPEHFSWVGGVQETARRAGLPVASQLRPDAAHAVPAPALAGGDASTGASGDATAPAGSDASTLALVPIDGEPAMLRVHTFIDGRVAAGAHQPEDYPAQVGRLAARLVAALADVPAEPGSAQHPWSFETTGANVVFTCDRISALEAAGQVPEEFGTRLSADLALARAHAQRFESDIRPLLAGLPQQVVHQDLNDVNILIADGAISGVIDFNDARTSARVAELAIAGAYAMIGRDDPRAALQATVEAYRAEAAGVEAAGAELGEDEPAIVEHAAITRLCLAACTWTARALTAPAGSAQSVFGRSRMTDAWPALRTMLEG